jgi:hypothetical protein
MLRPTFELALSRLALSVLRLTFARPLQLALTLAWLALTLARSLRLAFVALALFQLTL